MKEKLVYEVNNAYLKNYSPEEFVPVYNEENESIEWVRILDAGATIIRQSPSGKICLIEVDFLSGKCTIL